MLYIDDKLPTHPKIFKAGSQLGANGPARALALFMAGLAYARDQLTDGFIPEKFVASCVLVERPLDVARVLIDRRVRLWHRVRGGYQIHDYHHWNVSASVLKEKREKARIKKALQRARVRLDTSGDTDVSRDLSPGDMAGTLARGVPPEGVVRGTGEKEKGSLREKDSLGDSSPEVHERVDRFLVRYAELFERFRGARYAPQGKPDREAAVALVQTWDDQRLDVLVEAFFSTDDAYCRNGSGLITHFRTRASWCDGRLKEHGL